MKKLLLFFVISISFSTKAQTFIGRTEDDIMAMVKKNGYRFESKEEDKVADIHTFLYADTLLERHYYYSFDKNKKCNTYMIFTDSKSSRDAVKKEIEKNAFEKLSNRSWVQKIDGKLYGWQQQGSEEHATFITTELKQ